LKGFQFSLMIGGVASLSFRGWLWFGAAPPHGVD